MAEYIDRDAVLNAVLELPPKMDEQGYGWLGRRGVWQMISDFPTADVTPVVHGKWKDYPIADGCLQCSNCGVLRLEDPSNFCPNCGAKMT